MSSSLSLFPVLNLSPLRAAAARFRLSSCSWGQSQLLLVTMLKLGTHPEDTLFNSVGDRELIDFNVSRLTHSMSPVKGLILCGRVRDVQQL
jgi:hypothetical protein